ncbi:MAG: hypothetical protein L0211_00445 [Planctomycetaceae bacterium]|nr:hypothetical protein [Planctomycetaceae bacterium]
MKFALAGLLALVAITPAGAADLRKIELTITKEPAYTTKQPKYCLLVFGPEATTRVWLVVDGDSLCVDRNGNGDLTEPGERVLFPAFGKDGSEIFAASRSARVDVLFEGKLKHEKLVVTQQRVNPDVVAKERWEEVLLATAKAGEPIVYSLSISLEIRPRPGDPIRIAGCVSQYAGMDGAGFLQFADRREQAPIVHFRGQMQMGLHSPQQLVLGSQPAELLTVVGTPGLGKGTFASVPYAGLISDGAAPEAEIAFPPAVPVSTSLKAKYTLPHRC